MPVSSENEPQIPVSRKCKQCEVSHASNGLFCSEKCRWTWNNRNRNLKPNAIYDCIICGKHIEKWVAPSRIVKGIDTLEYCSRTCAGIGRRNVNHFRWGGGRKVDKDGYVLVFRPDHPNCDKSGFIREHRVVMEEHIGRILDAIEVVHHKNDDTSDNNITNLVLYSSNADHKRDDNEFRKRDSLGRYLPK